MVENIYFFKFVYGCYSSNHYFLLILKFNIAKNTQSILNDVIENEKKNFDSVVIKFNEKVKTEGNL